MRIKIQKAKGYSGKMGGKSWVREIEEIRGQGFDGDFLDADEVDWEDSELYKKKKGKWSEYYELDNGIFEVCEFGEREYLYIDKNDTSHELDKEELHEALSILENEGYGWLDANDLREKLNDSNKIDLVNQAKEIVEENSD